MDSLRQMKTRVYLFGEKVDNFVDHPLIAPSIRCIAMTYSMAQVPEYEELMTATSSLTGHKINRFVERHTIFGGSFKYYILCLLIIIYYILI